MSAHEAVKCQYPRVRFSWPDPSSSWSDPTRPARLPTNRDPTRPVWFFLNNDRPTDIVDCTSTTLNIEYCNSRSTTDKNQDVDIMLIRLSTKCMKQVKNRFNIFYLSLCSRSKQQKQHNRIIRSQYPKLTTMGLVPTKTRLDVHDSPSTNQSFTSGFTQEVLRRLLISYSTVSIFFCSSMVYNWYLQLIVYSLLIS